MLSQHQSAFSAPGSTSPSWERSYIVAQKPPWESKELLEAQLGLQALRESHGIADVLSDKTNLASKNARATECRWLQQMVPPAVNVSRSSQLIQRRKMNIVLPLSHVDVKSCECQMLSLSFIPRGYGYCPFVPAHPLFKPKPAHSTIEQQIAYIWIWMVLRVVI